MTVSHQHSNIRVPTEVFTNNAGFAHRDSPRSAAICYVAQWTRRPTVSLPVNNWISSINRSDVSVWPSSLIGCPSWSCARVFQLASAPSSSPARPPPAQYSRSPTQTPAPTHHDMTAATTSAVQPEPYSNTSTHTPWHVIDLWQRHARHHHCDIGWMPARWIWNSCLIDWHSTKSQSNEVCKDPTVTCRWWTSAQCLQPLVYCTDCYVYNMHRLQHHALWAIASLLSVP